jgi:hypothetical protein
MTRSIARSLVLVLVAVFLVAGCGGDDKGSNTKDKFTAAYKPLNDQLVALGGDVGTAVQSAKGKSDATLATQFALLEKRLNDLKSRLDALEPPDEFKADAQKLSAAMAVAAADLKAISDAAGAHDPTAARDSARRLVVDSVPLRDARRALARKTGAKV